jgi:hypothetical protein
VASRSLGEFRRASGCHYRKLKTFLCNYTAGIASIDLFDSAHHLIQAIDHCGVASTAQVLPAAPRVDVQVKRLVYNRDDLDVVESN